jgi:uncharacterized damage-inducible protein DinB
MNAKDVLRQNVEFTDMLTRAYVDDLTDAELLVRSVPGANHIAWQLGHMIGGTQQMLSALGHQAPALPEGFAAAHSAEAAKSDDPAKFATKAEYLSLLDEMKAAALAAIDATPDSALEGPSPEAMREYAPTVAAALGVVGTHGLMHAGQFVPIRRKLGKPPLF